MILLSKLLPMGNNLLGKMIIAHVINFFRQIIARVTNIRNYCPLAITKNHKNRSFSFCYLGYLLSLTPIHHFVIFVLDDS